MFTEDVDSILEDVKEVELSVSVVEGLSVEVIIGDWEVETSVVVKTSSVVEDGVSCVVDWEEVSVFSCVVDETDVISGVTVSVVVLSDSVVEEISVEVMGNDSVVKASVVASSVVEDGVSLKVVSWVVDKDSVFTEVVGSVLEDASVSVVEGVSVEVISGDTEVETSVVVNISSVVEDGVSCVVDWGDVSAFSDVVDSVVDETDVISGVVTSNDVVSDSVVERFSEEVIDGEVNVASVEEAGSENVGHIFINIVY